MNGIASLSSLIVGMGPSVGRQSSERYGRCNFIDSRLAGSRMVSEDLRERHRFQGALESGMLTPATAINRQIGWASAEVDRHGIVIDRILCGAGSGRFLSGRNCSVPIGAAAVSPHRG